MSTTTKLTEERAEQILNSYVQVDKVGHQYNGVKVGNISFTNKEGNPFTYPSGDEYAIVNLRAVTPFGLEKATEEFMAGNFNEACNFNMNASVPVELAESLTPGDLVSIVTNSYYSEKYDTELIGVATVKAPPAVNKLKKNSFSAMLKATRAKAEEIKLN